MAVPAPLARGGGGRVSPRRDHGPVELGLSLGLSPREREGRFVELARSAERLGVDALWVIDSQLAMKDAYVGLALLAHETERIRIGPGVTNLVTRHETVIANAMASLASIAPGRVTVGLGAGDSSVFPLGRRPSTIRECEAGVRRLRSLLAGEEVEGEAGGLRLSFAPDPPPPVYLAASQPRMLRLAGAVADGVIVMGPADPETVRMQMADVDAGAERAGRDPRAVFRDLWVTVAVGPTAVADVKSWASAQARWLTKWKQVPASLERFRDEMERSAATYDFGDHLSLRAGHAEAISDDFARSLAVAGDREECRRRLISLAGVGVDRITLTLLSGGRESRLEELAEIWDAVRSDLDPAVAP
ncbi:MAG: LLM class flavin-dependent oxidoreductase [Solirubrobacterales bacterium]|nr:LLM class flavin-dependent oxidoreductase [Solirubrobacterales bacterium]